MADSRLLKDESLMPWGKFSGTKMIDVPADYLLWLHDQGTKDIKVSGYIFENLQALREEVANQKKK